MIHYLLEDQNVVFRHQPNSSFSASSDDDGNGTTSTTNCGKFYRIVYRCDKIATNVDSLSEVLPNFRTARIQQNGDTGIQISMGLSEDKSAAIKIEGKGLGMLRQASFSKQVKVTLTMKRFHFGFKQGDSQWKSEYYPFVSTSTEEMDIRTSAELPFCIDANFALPGSVKEEWFNFVEWRSLNGSYNLNLIISVKLSIFENHSHMQTDKINRKMLHEAILSDVVIITEHGKEIPCHQGILGANSPVLKAMLENKMKESNTGRIEMPDISENGAKAFLQFLYYRDASIPLEDSSVALELFQAGEKYEIIDLKNAMENIFLNNDQSSYWTLDVTVGLFLFANQILTDFSGSGNRLKQKSIKILKRNYGDWKGSGFFQEFCKDEPQASAELLDGAFTFLI